MSDFRKNLVMYIEYFYVNFCVVIYNERYLFVECFCQILKLRLWSLNTLVHLKTSVVFFNIMGNSNENKYLNAIMKKEMIFN